MLVHGVPNPSKSVVPSNLVELSFVSIPFKLIPESVVLTVIISDAVISLPPNVPGTFLFLPSSPLNSQLK